MTDRRDFLRFIAGSPLLAAVGLDAHILRDLTSASPEARGDSVVARSAGIADAVDHSQGERGPGCFRLRAGGSPEYSGRALGLPRVRHR